MEVSGQPHIPAAILLEYNRTDLCIGGWVGPRADLDV
jgi:hypothetical protein